MSSGSKVVLAAFFLLFATSASGARIVCQVENAKLCQSGSCKAIYEDGIYATVIDTEKKAYLLCESTAEKEQCDPFPLEGVERGGAFMLYKTASAILKVALEDVPLFGLKKDEFVESRTSFLSVFVSWGTCRDL